MPLYLLDAPAPSPSLLLPDTIQNPKMTFRAWLIKNLTADLFRCSGCGAIFQAGDISKIPDDFRCRNCRPGMERKKRRERKKEKKEAGEEAAAGDAESAGEAVPPGEAEAEGTGEGAAAG